MIVWLGIAVAAPFVAVALAAAVIVEWRIGGEMARDYLERRATARQCSDASADCRRPGCVHAVEDERFSGDEPESAIADDDYPTYAAAVCASSWRRLIADRTRS